MAKEMMIVFVYDTQACTAEEDDPADAILYFHPGWVSDTQRHALAGQVIGTAHCVKSLFSPPVSITLQSGKFIIRDYGRYILAIGSDRNIPDWVLLNRADLLCGVIRVYHGDLSAVAALFDDRQRFADKLYHMFETYLPVLQYGCHIFQKVPMLTLPKSASSIYLEAMQILDNCRKLDGVLGGVILYNNKIVATQLPPALTSYLVVVDPYRVKSPAESAPSEVLLPPAAHLLLLHVNTLLLEELRAHANNYRKFIHNSEVILPSGAKMQETEKEKPREFQSGMKRDKSLLFTAVPEEDYNMISPPNDSQSENKPAMPDVVPFTNKPRPRPNKLSLSIKQKSVDEDTKENEIVFTGHTSVCSTPMVEYKKLHGNVLSICQNPEPIGPDVIKNIDKNETIDKDRSIVTEFKSIEEKIINKPESLRKLASVTDIQETFRRLSNRATAKFKFKKNKSCFDENNLSTMTINDPYFPVFRNDGVEISESLFNQYLEHTRNRNEAIDDNLFNFSTKKFEGFDSEMTKSPQRTPKIILKDSNKTVTDQSKRKSLSLPLKSLSEDCQTEEERGSFKKKLTGVQLTPLMEKLSHLAFSDKSSGYSSRVMTPLELRDLTPVVEKQITFEDRPKPDHPSTSGDADVDNDLDSMATYSQRCDKCALFVSGLQNMAVLLMLDNSALHDANVINTLWDICINSLGEVERACASVLEGEERCEYSYLTLDPEWGTVRRAGVWPSLDIATMGLIHDYFRQDRHLTEMVLRSADSVVLGSRCGGAEVYYRESAPPPPPGPPATAAPLCAAPLRARRRLQRDHNVLLL